MVGTGSSCPTQRTRPRPHDRIAAAELEELQRSSLLPLQHSAKHSERFRNALVPEQSNVRKQPGTVFSLRKTLQQGAG